MFGEDGKHEPPKTVKMPPIWVTFRTCFDFFAHFTMLALVFWDDFVYSQKSCFFEPILGPSRGKFLVWIFEQQFKSRPPKIRPSSRSSAMDPKKRRPGDLWGGGWKTPPKFGPLRSTIREKKNAFVFTYKSHAKCWCSVLCIFGGVEENQLKQIKRQIILKLHDENTNTQD